MLLECLSAPPGEIFASCGGTRPLWGTPRDAAGAGGTSCDAAPSTLEGIALRHRRKKGRLVAAAGEEGFTAVVQGDALAA